MDHVVLSEGRPVAHHNTLFAASDPTRPPTTLKPLIVLVNASPQCAQALRAVLGRQYRLKEYASGEQAWASLQIDAEAAAVVCSKTLPRMSGLELVAKLRKARLPALRQIPVCLVADTIDDDLRGRDRPPASGLHRRLRPAAGGSRGLAAGAAGCRGSRPTSRRARSDALRRWAHQHAGLDEKMRESLVVFRVVSEGVGVLSERLAGPSGGRR